MSPFKRPVQLVGLSIAALLCALSTLALPAAAAPPSSINVSISPAFVKLETSSSYGFTATVSNDSKNEGVSWSIDGVNCTDVICGTLSAPSSASGTAITYTAPSDLPPATIVVTATSVADPTKSATAFVV